MSQPDFTEDEIITVYQIIDKPAATFFTMTDAAGTAMYGLNFSNGQPGDSIQTIFNTVVAAMQAKSDAYKLRIRSLITSWLAIDLRTSELDGDVDDVKGIKFSYDKKRKEIRRQMVNLIPFLDHYDALAKNSQVQPIQVRRIR